MATPQPLTLEMLQRTGRGAVGHTARAAARRDEEKRIAPYMLQAQQSRRAQDLARLKWEDRINEHEREVGFLREQQIPAREQNANWLAVSEAQQDLEEKRMNAEIAQNQRSLDNDAARLSASVVAQETAMRRLRHEEAKFAKTQEDRKALDAAGARYVESINEHIDALSANIAALERQDQLFFDREADNKVRAEVINDKGWNKAVATIEQVVKQGIEDNRLVANPGYADIADYLGEVVRTRPELAEYWNRYNEYVQRKETVKRELMQPVRDPVTGQMKFQGNGEVIAQQRQVLSDLATQQIVTQTAAFEHNLPETAGAPTSNIPPYTVPVASEFPRLTELTRFTPVDWPSTPDYSSRQSQTADVPLAERGITDVSNFGDPATSGYGGGIGDWIGSFRKPPAPEAPAPAPPVSGVTGVQTSLPTPPSAVPTLPSYGVAPPLSVNPVNPVYVPGGVPLGVSYDQGRAGAGVAGAGVAIPGTNIGQRR